MRALKEILTNIIPKQYLFSDITAGIVSQLQQAPGEVFMLEVEVIAEVPEVVCGVKRRLQRHCAPLTIQPGVDLETGVIIL